MNRETQTHKQTVMAAARDGEPDRLAAALLAPEPQQNALIALAAFSASLRAIPFAVSEPMMGEVRLQWWRDVLTKGERSGHPVADTLMAACETHALPKAQLIAMTEARAFDLYTDPMPDAATLDAYLQKTEGIPFELALRITGRAPGLEYLALLSLATRAYGLVRLAATWANWRSRGRTPFPISRTREVPDCDADATPTVASTEEVLFFNELKRDIRSTLANASARAGIVSRQERIAFLPLAVVRAYLRALDQAETPVHTPVEILPVTRMTRIWLAHVSGRL
jgi:phytoene synthase